MDQEAPRAFLPRTTLRSLEGWLIFPDSHAKSPADSKKTCKNAAFPSQSKHLTCWHYGKINQPLAEEGELVQADAKQSVAQVIGGGEAAVVVRFQVHR